jgi:hypothetical protein
MIEKDNEESFKPQNSTRECSRYHNELIKI